MNDAILLGMNSSYHTFDEAKYCPMQLLSKETCIDSGAYMYMKSSIFSLTTILLPCNRSGWLWTVPDTLVPRQREENSFWSRSPLLTDKLIKHTSPYFPTGRGLFFKVFSRQKKRGLFSSHPPSTRERRHLLAGKHNTSELFLIKKIRLVCCVDSTIQPLNDWGQYVTC